MKQKLTLFNAIITPAVIFGLGSLVLTRKPLRKHGWFNGADEIHSWLFSLAQRRRARAKLEADQQHPASWRVPEGWPRVRLAPPPKRGHSTGEPVLPGQRFELQQGHRTQGPAPGGEIRWQLQHPIAPQPQAQNDKATAPATVQLGVRVPAFPPSRVAGRHVSWS